MVLLAWGVACRRAWKGKDMQLQLELRPIPVPLQESYLGRSNTLGVQNRGFTVSA
jgi:hypothetical protein